MLPQFFDLAIYLPRVIRLATACEDFAHVRSIIEALKKLCEQVKNHCEVSVKAWPEGEEKPNPTEMINRWQKQLFSSVRESITAAFPPRLSKEGKQTWKVHMEGFPPAAGLLDWPLSVKDLQTQQARLFSFDLAHLPFRFIGLPKEMVAQRGIPARRTVINCTEAAKLLPDKVTTGIQPLAKWIGFKSLPYSLLFATRPFNLPELFFLKDAYAETERTTMQGVVLAVRGFELNEKAPCFDKHGILQISDGNVT